MDMDNVHQCGVCKNHFLALQCSYYNQTNQFTCESITKGFLASHWAKISAFSSKTLS